MSESAIVFDHVWKRFQRGERHDSLRDLIPAVVRRLTNGPTPDDAHAFWAVRDVSFEVKKGEALGIIGPNGAGKSTALKLLTRILKPTQGRCHVTGRVGALIEVASGFHPDLTGRENVFLQGALMGMKRHEIAKNLDAIIEFSGISDFIDTPVKRYSSGMNARLGFSIAAHLNPDVLIIDEVLSVGDMSFQAKCLERMKQNVASGVTLAFVSHNLQAVSLLCKTALVLGQGQALFHGPTAEALTVYMEAAQTRDRASVQDAFRICSSSLTWPGKQGNSLIEPHSEGVLDVVLECLRPVSDFNLGVELIRSRDLLYCYGASTEEIGPGTFTCTAGQKVHLTFGFSAHLARGHYFLNLNVRHPSSSAHLFVAERLAQFSIGESVTYDGVVEIESRASVDIVNADASATRERIPC